MGIASIADFSTSNRQIRWIAAQLVIAQGSDPTTQAQIASDMAATLTALVAAYNAVITELKPGPPSPTSSAIQQTGYIFDSNDPNRPFAFMRLYPLGSSPTTPGFQGKEVLYQAERNVLQLSLTMFWPNGALLVSGLASAITLLQAIPIRD